VTIFTLTNGPDYVDTTYDSADHTWYALKGEDDLYLGSGNDIVYGYWGDDQINGGAGNDIIYGGDDHDYLFGEEGHDTLVGGRGNDYLDDDDSAWGDGGLDIDRLFGGPGNDTILADNGHVSGGGGNDVIAVESVNATTVRLGYGSDKLHVNFSDMNGTGDVVEVADFKVDDKLLMYSSSFEQGRGWGNSEILDLLDVNNDKWLGAKDVEARDWDGYTVRTTADSLIFEIADNELVLHGMIKASFDFLS
jgi:Ca2+-binding RTX toxin-like protein